MKIQNQLALLIVLFLVSCGGGGSSGDASGPEAPGPANLEIFQTIPTEAAPGQSVLIKGEGFGKNPNAVLVYFNGVQALVGSVDDFSISAVVPAEATTGPIVVDVFSGTKKKSAEYPLFFVNLDPTIEGFAPETAPIGGTVTISGFNFGALASDIQVLFGKEPAAVLSSSPTQITAIVPEKAKTDFIFVAVKDSIQKSKKVFVVDVKPTIEKIEPLVGMPGDEVTIQGKNLVGKVLDPQFSVVKVNFGGGAKAVVLAASLTAVKVLVPDGALTGPLGIETSEGKTTSNGNFYLPPVISDFFPKSGPPGSTVTIQGKNFGATVAENQVSLGGKKVVVSAASANEVKVEVPFDATSGVLSLEVLSPLGPIAVQASEPFSIRYERFLQVLSSTENTFSNLTVDAATGQVSHHGIYFAGDSSGAAPGKATAMVQAHEKFLYVINEQADSVSSFVVSAINGSIQEIGTPNKVGVSGNHPSRIRRDPAGKFLFVYSDSQASSASLAVFAIDAVSGELDQVDQDAQAEGVQEFILPVGSEDFAVDSSGAFLYVAAITGAKSQNLPGYRIENDGILTPLGGNSPEGYFSHVEAHPSLPLLYAADNFSNQILPLSVDSSTGALVAVSGQPLTIGAVDQIQFDPTGEFLFVLNATQDLGLFRVGSNNHLTPALSLALGGKPTAVGFNGSGSQLYITTVEDKLWSYHFDHGVTPSLTLQGSARIPRDPIGIVLVPGEAPSVPEVARRFLLVGNEITQDLRVFDVLEGGKFQENVKGGPYALAKTPKGIVTAHAGHRAYIAAGSGAGNLISYEILETGELVPLQGALSVTGDAVDIAIDRTSRFLYVLSNNATAARVTVFRLDAQGLAQSSQEFELLEVVSSTQFKINPGRKIAMDPAGDLLYVSGPLATGSVEGVRPFRIVRSKPGSVTDGNIVPTSVGIKISSATTPVPTLLNGIATHPSGEFLVVAGKKADGSGVAVLAAVASASGLMAVDNDLTNFNANGGVIKDDASPGLDSFAALFDPSGIFLLVTNATNSFQDSSIAVLQFDMNATTVHLKHVVGSPFTTVQIPTALAADWSAGHLFVSHPSENALTSLSMTGNSGGLQNADFNISHVGPNAIAIAVQEK